MTIGEVKKNLNNRVSFRGGVYELSGCTIRKNKKTQQFFYQAELLDVMTNNSVVRCKLSDIEEIKDGDAND